MEATCKTCPFWGPFAACNSKGVPVEPTTGTCRRNPPVPMMTESGGDHPELTHENPEVPDFWFCGEHPLRQRDRLAAMAMQGLLAAPSFYWDHEIATSGIPFREVIAVNAYDIADAMLAARARGTEAP
jgi:hypothetical protein